MHVLRTLIFYCLCQSTLSDGSQLGEIDGGTLAKKLDTLAKDTGIKFIQEKYDETPYVVEQLEGLGLIAEISQNVGYKFRQNIQAAVNLRNVVQEQFANFGTSTNFKTCCRLGDSDLEYDPRFKSKVDSRTICVHKSKNAFPSPQYANEAVLRQMKDNYAVNPNLKWQYFGSEQGLFFGWPAFKMDSCTQYDPRYRPWYVEAATPTPKDIVLAIDISGSMVSNHRGIMLLDIAKDAAKTVLDTLNPRDRVGIVTFSHYAKTPPGTAATSGCYSDSIAQATPQNIKYLKSFLDDTDTSGGTEYIPAIERSFDLLHSWDTNEARDKAILFLTDGQPYDEQLQIMDTIHKRNRQFNNSVIILTYALGSGVNEKAQKILRLMSEQHGYNSSYGEVTPGTYTYIKDPLNLRMALASYYNFFSGRSSESAQPAISIPYSDAFGLGLITTVALPVYFEDVFKGVIGIDISMSDLLSDVTYFKQGDYSYAFIIDSKGRTMMHPLLPRPYSVEEPPIFVNISDLEPAEDAKTMIESMKSGEIGEKRYRSRHILSRGDTKQDGVLEEILMTHFLWHPISGTNFSVCIALADVDRQASLPTMTLQQTDTFLYHNLHLSHPKTECKHFKRYSSKSSSCVKFTPSAFLQPYTYLDRVETASDVDAYEMYFRGLNPQNPGFKPNVRSAVAKTLVANEFWMQHNTAATNNSIWRYFGSEEGVIRLYPATTLAKSYDHFARGWYKKAVSHRGLNVLSAPYMDAWGAGVMITLARTIYQGRKSGEHFSTDLIAGVLGTDLTLQTFYSLMIEANPSCSGNENVRCLVMDDSGYIVMHEDFQNASADVEGIHIIDKEPWLAEALIKSGLLKNVVCINYERISYQVTWRVMLSPHIKPSTDFVIDKVEGSNVFVIKFSTNHNDVSSCKCQKDYTQCTNPSSSMRSCECPCFTNAKFGYCSNSFSISSDSWTACTPRTPTPTYVIKSEESMIGSMERCFDMQCHERKNKSSCFGIVGCRWCASEECLYLEETCSSGASLSAGAIGGIVVGSVVVVVVILIVAAILRKRRQASKPDDATTDADSRIVHHVYENPQSLSFERPSASGYEEPIRRLSNNAPAPPGQMPPDICQHHPTRTIDSHRYGTTGDHNGAARPRAYSEPHHQLYVNTAQHNTPDHYSAVPGSAPPFDVHVQSNYFSPRSDAAISHYDSPHVLFTRHRDTCPSYAEATQNT